MRALKLEVIGTGGNCEAYHCLLPNGWHLAITDSGDPSLPDAHSTHVDVGIYRDEGWMDQVTLEKVKIISRLAREDPAHMKHVCEVIAYQVAEKHCELEDEDPHAKDHLGPVVDHHRRQLIAEHLEEHWPKIRETFAMANWPDTAVGNAANCIDCDMPDIILVLREES